MPRLSLIYNGLYVGDQIVTNVIANISIFTPDIFCTNTNLFINLRQKRSLFMTNSIDLVNGKIEVDVLLFKEDEYHIAYVPSFNLTSHSLEASQAITELENAIKLFFDSWGADKLHQKLLSLGWKEEKEDQVRRILPSNENFTVPYTLLDKTFSKTKLNVPAFA